MVALPDFLCFYGLNVASRGVGVGRNERTKAGYGRRFPFPKCTKGRHTNEFEASRPTSQARRDVVQEHW